MTRTTYRLIGAALSVAAIVALTACSSDDRATSERTSAEMPSESLIAEAYAEAEATVQSIDTESRDVTLKLADGRTTTVQAPADVDLARLEPGDVVVFGAYERLSVKALPPGSAPLGTTREAGMAQASPEDTPGRAVGQVTTTVTEITAIDTENNTVTLIGATGETRTLEVRNPDNQRKLKALEVGDLVQIELTEVAAASLKPKP